MSLSPAIDAGSNALAVDPFDNSALVTDQRGAARIVDATATGTPTVDIGSFERLAPSAASNFVFVTSTVYAATVGGLAGADSACQSRATASALPEDYRAWLSTTTTSAADHLIHSASPYVLVDGTVIASDWTDLTDGLLLAPINLNENGGLVSAEAVWTATGSNGSQFSGETCGNWNSDLGRVAVGDTSQTDSRWTAVTVNPCSASARLYCFRQLAPSAADVSVSGRVVSAGGNGVPRALVTITAMDGTARTALTNPFGYFRFDDVRAGETYLVNVASKTYQFEPQLVTVNDNVDDLVFTGLPPGKPSVPEKDIFNSVG